MLATEFAAVESVDSHSSTSRFRCGALILHEEFGVDLTSKRAKEEN